MKRLSNNLSLLAPLAVLVASGCDNPGPGSDFEERFGQPPPFQEETLDGCPAGAALATFDGSCLDRQEIVDELALPGSYEVLASSYCGAPGSRDHCILVVVDPPEPEISAAVYRFSDERCNKIHQLGTEFGDRLCIGGTPTSGYEVAHRALIEGQVSFSASEATSVVEHTVQEWVSGAGWEDQLVWLETTFRDGHGGGAPTDHYKRVDLIGPDGLLVDSFESDLFVIASSTDDGCGESDKSCKCRAKVESTRTRVEGSFWGQVDIGVQTAVSLIGIDEPVSIGGSTIAEGISKIRDKSYAALEEEHYAKCMRDPAAYHIDGFTPEPSFEPSVKKISYVTMVVQATCDSLDDNYELAQDTTTDEERGQGLVCTTFTSYVKDCNGGAICLCTETTTVTRGCAETEG